MIINLDYYRYFYYVAKYKNFTQASEILMCNQPNITRAVKKLESALGYTLFIRSNRGVTLTPEGEKLFVHISVAIEHIEAGEEELSKEKSLQHGIVMMGVSEIALHGFILPVLSQFHQRYPAVRMHICNHTTLQAISALNSGLIDFAVVTAPADIQKPIKQTMLKSFREIAVCGNSMSFLKNKKLHLSDLMNYPTIILSKGTTTYDFYNKLFMNYGLNLIPDMEVATADQILPLVKSNLGIGFLPDTFAEPAINNGDVFAIELVEEIPERQLCILKRSDRSLTIAAKELESMILDTQ